VEKILRTVREIFQSNGVRGGNTRVNAWLPDKISIQDAIG